MQIFHGSDVEVKKPQILKTNRFLDFGIGFYTTTSYEQAENWAKRVSVRNNSKKCFISVYEFDEEIAKQELLYEEFEMYANEKWLSFIIKCRNGFNPKEDIVKGPVADDNVYATIRNYESKVYDLEYTLKQLKTEKLKDQILFHTEKSLKYIKYVKAIEVNLDE